MMIKALSQLLNFPASLKVYQRDRPPRTVVRCGALRQKLQNKLAIPPCCSILVLGTGSTGLSADPGAQSILQHGQ